VTLKSILRFRFSEGRHLSDIAHFPERVLKTDGFQTEE
jgi:hypothetical protein